MTIKVNNYFKIGEHNIEYISPEFIQWFAGKSFATIKAPKTYPKYLEKDMTVEEIQETKNKIIGFTLGRLTYLMDALVDNPKEIEKMPDLVKAIGGLCFLKDKKNVTRIVHIRFFNGGWNIFAYELSPYSHWSAGTLWLSTKK